MNRAATVALAPLSSLFRAVMVGRRAFYQRGIFRVLRVGVPVISVGNLTTGGTGKTPLVEWICSELARNNCRVCILTRGYGRKHPRRRVVVSNITSILSNAEEAGDEPLLLAERLQGRATVISDADRVAAARWAQDQSLIDVFVLDDGFQYLRLGRNLDIVTIDATNPWGNRLLLPAGILREPPRELSRADCIIITRAEGSKRDEQLRQEIQQLSKGSLVLCSRMKIGGYRPVNTKIIAENSRVKSTPAAAFCAIGNPQSFFEHLRRDGHTLCHTQAFRDHHTYSQTDIDRLSSDSIARGAQALLTTAKDEVKLRSLGFNLPCYVADLKLEIEDEEKLRTIISQALQTPSR